MAERGGPGLSSVERYTIATDSWDFVAALPTPRPYVRFEALGGLIYSIGGSNGMLTAEYTSKFAAGFTAKFTAEFTSAAVAATGHTTPA